METCRDQHILMQTVSLFWHRKKVHLSSSSPIILVLTVPKHMRPRQTTNGQGSVIFSRCKFTIPSSLSSRLVTEPVNTGFQLKGWQAQSLLLGVSFCGSCHWLNVLWIFHVFSWWGKTFSDFSYWLWKAKIQRFVKYGITTSFATVIIESLDTASGELSKNKNRTNSRRVSL